MKSGNGTERLKIGNGRQNGCANGFPLHVRNFCVAIGILEIAPTSLHASQSTCIKHPVCTCIALNSRPLGSGKASIQVSRKSKQDSKSPDQVLGIIIEGAGTFAERLHRSANSRTLKSHGQLHLCLFFCFHIARPETVLMHLIIVL